MWSLLLVGCAAAELLDTKDFQTETDSQRTERFEGVFLKVNGSSGGGSTLHYTQKTQQTLHGLIRRLGIRTLLDVPCGDFVWMPKVLEQHPQLQYLGGDIVPAQVARHTKRFPSAHSSWKFQVVDMVRALPEGIWDLVLNRDVLQHLSPGDIIKYISNINQTRFGFWLVTDYTAVKMNQKARHKDMGWDTHLYNLQLPPYNLPRPMDRFQEGGHGKTLALYKLPLIRIPGEKAAML